MPCAHLNLRQGALVLCLLDGAGEGGVGDTPPEEAMEGDSLHLPDKGPSGAQRKLSHWDHDLEKIMESLPLFYITCSLS